VHLTAVTLPLWDLSAGFDMVDHAAVLSLVDSTGLGGAVFTWFESYRDGRTQFV